jgi:hypothetical protein
VNCVIANKVDKTQADVEQESDSLIRFDSNVRLVWYSENLSADKSNR